MSFHIEDQIREAQDAGHFEALSGKGKPLALSQNPFANEDQLAQDLLRNNSFSLPWIEEKREIEAQIDRTTRQLRRIWVRFNGSRQAAYAWREAKMQFRHEVDKINKQILTFNLKAPNPHFHMLPVDAEKKIKSVQMF